MLTFCLEFHYHTVFFWCSVDVSLLVQIGLLIFCFFSLFIVVFLIQRLWQISAVISTMIYFTSSNFMLRHALILKNLIYKLSNELCRSFQDTYCKSYLALGLLMWQATNLFFMLIFLLIWSVPFSIFIISVSWLHSPYRLGCVHKD